jgi:hypothetical protein
VLAIVGQIAFGFSIVTRANKALNPGADRRCRPEVTETYIDFFTAAIRNRNTRLLPLTAC